MKQIFDYFLFEFKQLKLKSNNLLITFVSYITIILNKFILLKNLPVIKLFLFVYRSLLILNGLLILGLIFHYSELFVPHIGLDNLFNLYLNYIIEIKDYIINKIINILDINFTEETKIFSKLNNDTTILPTEINNTSTDSITTETPVLEPNKPKTPFYSYPFVYLPFIITGAVIIYLGSGNIISVVSERLSFFNGNSGGGPVIPDWTPPTYPLYDLFPELEREMDLIAALNEQID
jgi:hypothetical protein